MFGPEGGGKSTLLLQIIGNVQRQSKRYCALIDSEHAFDPNYAASLGVDTDNLVVSQPGCGEEALDIAEGLIKSEATDLVAIDSAAMLTPRSEIEGEIGDSHVGGRARLVTQALSRLISIIPKYEVAVVFINQLRDIIGFSGYGDGTNTPCGRSLKHNASLRIEVKRIAALKIGDKIVGNRTRFRIAKVKIGGSPYQQTEADMLYGSGFSREGDLIDFGVSRDVLKKSGAKYEFEDLEFTRGRESFRTAMLAEAELADRIYAAILTQLEKSPPSENKGIIYLTS